MRNILRKAILILCCGTTALLTGGCMSGRVVTNLKPGSDPGLTSPAGHFSIAGVNYSTSRSGVPDNSELGRNQARKFEQAILPLLRQECAARFPGLFAQDHAQSIPVGVEIVNDMDMHEGKVKAWVLCTLTICGCILPGPGQADQEFAIKAGVWNGRNGIAGSAIKTGFRREDHYWVSVLTPLALIPIPGKSDLPKVSGTIFGIQQQEATFYRQAAGQIATALARQIATTKPEQWLTPVSSEVNPLTLPAVPLTTLPPPVESGSPF